MRLKRKLYMGIGIALLVFCSPGPAFSQISISNGLSHKKVSESADTYDGFIVIKNQGVKNERVRLYQTDYFYYADGSNLYGEVGSHERTNARWIRLEKDEVTIAPGQEQEVAYVVKVPPVNELTGTYWSLVMVQAITDSILNPDQAEDTLGVTSGVRFAVQIITNIGDTGTRDIGFSNTSLEKSVECSVLSVDMENTGERILSAFPYMDVYDSSGSYVGRFESRQRSLLPGTSVRVQIPMPGLEPGAYKAQVVADCGGNDLFGAVYSIRLK